MSPENALIIEHTYSQVPEERRVLGQFPGRRANTMIANDHGHHSCSTGTRGITIYKEFLLGIQAACRNQGQSTIVLCAGAIGKKKKMHRHEARGTDNTYALHCLLRPKTYYLKFVVSITAQYNIPQTGMNPKFRATLYVPYRST